LEDNVKLPSSLWFGGLTDLRIFNVTGPLLERKGRLIGRTSFDVGQILKGLQCKDLPG